MPPGDAADGGDPLAALLAGRYPDPETGEPLGAASRAVVIEDSLAGREAELVAALGIGPRLVVVADDATMAALGERVTRALGVGAGFSVDAVVLPGAVHADAETLAAALARVDPDARGIVAVGAGTINDLSKLIALARGVPQVVFATAPSMNGYTSVSASIVEAGIKRSIRAETPVGVFFDLEVLARAPARLVRAGLGDSACRTTAQADWLLQHVALDRPYREAPFALLADDERALFARARALAAGDLVAMRHLVRTLVLSGFGMTICGGSFPASQAEHLIAHYVEMMAPADLPHALHGEQIGVATLAIARIWDEILARDTAPVVRATALTPAELAVRYGEARGDALWRDIAPKLLDEAGAAAASARLAAAWPTLRPRLQSIALGAARIDAVLADAGAPRTPAELGWPDALVADAIAHAREIRDRYTCLDLIADSDAGT
jgi:glycerol-1-phosphate dehydrogenase [NAD(P)+]